MINIFVWIININWNIMSDIRDLEFAILMAADRWAREISRTDKELTKSEELLYNAVLEYDKVVKEQAPIIVEKKKNIFIPPPPKLPQLRESQKPTIPARKLKRD